MLVQSFFTIPLLQSVFFLWIFLGVLAGCASTKQSTTLEIGKIHTLREQYANIHLIEAGEKLILIDTGLEESAPKFYKRIKKMGFDPTLVNAIIVTHGHQDHAGGAFYFQQQFNNAPILAGDGDKEMLAGRKKDKLCPTSKIARRRQKKDQASPYQPYQADEWINTPTDLYPLIGLDGQIIPVPGHTDGALVVILGNAAFVGDLFRGSIMGSNAETHFYMCDLEDNKRDIRDLLEAYPEVQVFFTGHFGPVSRNSVEKYLAKQK